MSPRSSAPSASHFFIAGAQRCGTTYLYRLLEQHPQIEMARPLRPEPKFFLRADAERSSLEEYHRACFSGRGRGRVRGEKSTSYLEHEEAARRIRALLPDAKLIFLLRNPVERAISNYWFNVEQGVEHAPMAEAFRREEERREDYDRERFSVSPFAYIRRGRYLDDLEVYARLFPLENLRLQIFEKFIKEEKHELRGIFEFLGVAADFRPRRPRTGVNASPRREAVADDLRRFLVEQFADSNRMLAARFGLHLSDWQSAVHADGRELRRAQ